MDKDDNVLPPSNSDSELDDDLPLYPVKASSPSQASSKYLENARLFNSTLAGYVRSLDSIQSKLKTNTMTWIFATFIGAGFLLTNLNSGLPFSPFLAIAFVFFAGTCSITPLFVLDRLVYQLFIDSAFHTGLQLEERYPELPEIRTNILLLSHRHRLSTVLSSFYLGCYGILFLFADAALLTWLWQATSPMTTIICGICSFVALRVTYRIIKRWCMPIVTRVRSYDNICVAEPDLFEAVWKQSHYVTQTIQSYGEMLSLKKQMVSTVLLAAFTGTGFVLSVNDIVLFKERLLVAPFICLAGNIGVLLLWVTDLLGYHRIVHAAFMAGIQLEQQYSWLPPVWHNILDSINQDPNCIANRMAGIYVFCSLILLLIGGISLAFWIATFSIIGVWIVGAIYLIAMGLAYYFLLNYSAVTPRKKL